MYFTTWSPFQKVKYIFFNWHNFISVEKFVSNVELISRLYMIYIFIDL